MSKDSFEALARVNDPRFAGHLRKLVEIGLEGIPFSRVPHGRSDVRLTRGRKIPIPSVSTDLLLFEEKLERIGQFSGTRLGKFLLGDKPHADVAVVISDPKNQERGKEFTVNYEDRVLVRDLPSRRSRPANDEDVLHFATAVAGLGISTDE